ncbi:hypothetical protein [Thiohalophilus thiocyanatoxydans]|uniref:hypothetical protein n=1 Tax=Thiohalophilus thiocyanatoxydans TaxID=381308 RepID=UPI0010666FD2|nr:hypothetical protein [Thiohalophilus thiocyanatoxydans]
MKTPILRKYEARLAEVNDQLIYFLFSDAEVEAHLEKNTKNNEDKYTTDIFPDNQFSERLHIKASALTEFRRKSFNTLVGVSLISAVEYLLYYIEEIEDYRASVLPSLHDSINDDKPEQQLASKIKAWGGNEIHSAIIKTIKYLRLRRNHIAHLGEEMTQDFSSLIKNDANHLNGYWKSKKNRNL